MSKPDQTRTPDLLVERLALDELPSERAAEIRARLASEQGGAQRLDEIRRSNADILEVHSSAPTARAIELRLHTATVQREAYERGRRRALWPAMIGAPAAVAIAVALVFAWPAAEGPGGSLTTGPDTVRLKGEARLEIHRVVGQRADALNDDDSVGARDVLQLSYVASGQHSGVLFSIDGNGVVTLHFPAQEGDNNELDQGGRVTVPHGYELDDSPDFERFFFVTSSTSVSTQGVLRAGRELARDLRQAQSARLQLPEELAQDSILLRKRP
jgi:hypothetical protein